MKRIIYLLVAAIGLLVGCTPDEETWVQAGFTTDKESYEIGDLITLTNTSTAENAQKLVTGVMEGAAALTERTDDAEGEKG